MNVRINCPYCGYTLDTAGNCNNMSCPQKSGQPVGIPGWICPVCGRGMSPFQSSCPCVETKTKSNLTAKDGFYEVLTGFQNMDV